MSQQTTWTARAHRGPSHAKNRWSVASSRSLPRRASHSRLEPFKKLAQTIRTHLDGILSWTRLRVTNGALEGMNN